MRKTFTSRVCLNILTITIIWHSEVLWAPIVVVQPVTIPPTKILTNGAIVVKTGIATDLAIDGPGWFMLRDPDAPLIWENHVTRRGTFYLDSSGCVVSPAGLRLQGYNDPGLSNLGDIVVDAQGAPPRAEGDAVIVSLKFDSEGRLLVTMSDATTFVRGQVLLQAFQAPERLTREAYNLYTATAAAGPSERPTAPGIAGLGRLLVGWLDETPEPIRLSLFPSANQTGALSEGVLTPTGIPTDLGIHGPGFFLVRDTNNSSLFATRAGMFPGQQVSFAVLCRFLMVRSWSDLLWLCPRPRGCFWRGRPITERLLGPVRGSTSLIFPGWPARCA